MNFVDNDGTTKVYILVHSWFCNTIPGTMLQNIHRVECCRYWGHLATRATIFDFCRRTALRMSSCQCKWKIVGLATALGGVHTVPDSETERCRKCTGYTTAGRKLYRGGGGHDKRNFSSCKIF